MTTRTLIDLSANLTGLTFPVNPVAFDREVYDSAGAFNPAVPGEIVVPAGASFFHAQGSVRVPDSASTGSLFLSIYKNGADALFGMDMRRNGTAGYSNNMCMAIAPWQPCTPGDILTLRCNVTLLGTPSQILAGFASWFFAEFE